MREEVQSIANLLRVYVTQDFSQFQMTQKQNLEAGASKPAFKVASFWRGKPERDDRKAVVC